MFPDGTEGVFIFTKAGSYRGGHSHDKPETSLLMSGKMLYKKRDNHGKETEFIQSPGDVLHNGAGEVHLAYALSDGWIFDWKIGVKAGETKTTNDPSFRRYVEEQRR